MMAGNLREPIKLFAITKEINNLGEPVKSNVFVKNIRSEVKYDSGQEKESDGQLTAQQIITFNMRYDSTIDETMLIEFRGNMYDIRYISHVLKYETILKTTKRKNNV
jgi:SPP1 family predicted phage head-tail adaptor